MDIPEFPKTPFIEIGTPQNGMTLRDYFAAKAMEVSIGDATRPPAYTYADKAKYAYEMADAMMKAREA